jgi:hypothetical protein
MKNILGMSNALFWILAGLPILALYPGCAATENNTRPIKIPSNVQASQAQKSDKTQWASNAQRTLYGENAGDFIILQWSLNDSAAEYFVYRVEAIDSKGLVIEFYEPICVPKFMP